jgi:hypothetical protein
LEFGIGSLGGYLNAERPRDPRYNHATGDFAYSPERVRRIRDIMTCVIREACGSFTNSKFQIPNS